MINSETNAKLSELNRQGINSPRVSVVIPVYNEERRIGRCIESVENQDYPIECIEFIVVDDGSLDRSADIAREHGAKVLRQENRGRGAARNRGVDEASAEIIAFIDADDIVEKSWLKEAIPLLDDERTAAVGCSYYLLNKKNEFVKFSAMQGPFRRRHCTERTDSLSTSGCLYKKSVLKEVGGFDPRMNYGEDMELSSRITNQGYSLHFINKPLIGVEFTDNLREYLSQQINRVAHSVILYLRPKGMKVAGGSTGPADYTQGLLPIAFLISVPFLAVLAAWQVPIALAIALLLLLILNIPFIHFVFTNRGSAELSRYWLFSLLSYLIVRCLCWGSGLIYGMCLILRHPSTLRHPIAESKGV